LKFKTTTFLSLARIEEDRHDLLLLSIIMRKKNDMAQQEIHYQALNSSKAENNYSGYEGATPHEQQQHFAGLYGQKLSGPVSSTIPTPGQRLALAIVSLAMLMAMIFGLIIVGIATNAGAGGTVGLVFVLVLFFSAVITINALFNRKH
jgi:hypothetical protein